MQYKIRFLCAVLGARRAPQKWTLWIGKKKTLFRRRSRESVRRIQWLGNEKFISALWQNNYDIQTRRITIIFRENQYIVMSFFNLYKTYVFFDKSMNKINGVSAFLQKRYIFKIISSKKYSTVFNDFLFPVKQRSSVLTSAWNHSIRLIHR